MRSFVCFHMHSLQINDSGLSLSVGGQGFPQATMNVVPNYFHRKIEEK